MIDLRIDYPASLGVNVGLDPVWNLSNNALKPDKDCEWRSICGLAQGNPMYEISNLSLVRFDVAPNKNNNNSELRTPPQNLWPNTSHCNAAQAQR